MPCIGEIWSTLLPFYDVQGGRMCFKQRPVLVIAQADSEDFVVLPISKIAKIEKRHPVYDIPVEPAKYGCLNLQTGYCSYIRTHKQTVSHKAQFTRRICGNIKALYEDLYMEILTKREEFSCEATTQALQ